MGIYKRYFKKYKFMFFMAVSCVFFEAVCDLLQPTIMSRIIDTGIKSGQIQPVIKYGIVMLSITALGACFAVSRNILASKVSQSFGADLRYDVFSKIINFSEISADKIESGSLITRMTNDTSQVTQFINGLMRVFFKAPLTCIGSIIFAALLSIQLGIVLFAVVLIVSFIIVISMKMSYKRFSKVQYAIDKVNTVVQEYLMGVRLVKAFGRYDDEKTKFNKFNSDLSDKSIASQLVVAYFAPLMTLAVSIGIAITIYLGSKLFVNREIEVGKVAAFINYMAQILTSLVMITNIFNTFVRTKASTERINEILSGEDDFIGGNEKIKPDKGEITFENVTFSYPGGSGVPAVKNLSFNVKSGETLAIIGPTGSGKSTVAWLCLRFYDVEGGTIYLNGTDIKDIGSNLLRDAVALAPQNSMLFTGTISENIAWGDAEISKEVIVEAARTAHAHEFIKKIPGQYDGILGQNGVNLSGGQKQRVSIARALIKNSPVLILDDCTSALDAVTESKIRQSLHGKNKNRTVVMITQRVGTAMFADKVLVLDNGENVGFGTHSELLESCETYKGIYDSQIGGTLTGK